MEDFHNHLHAPTSDQLRNYTPLKSNLNLKLGIKKTIFLTLVPFLIAIISISVYLHNSKRFVENGLAGSIAKKAEQSPTTEVSLQITITPSPQPSNNSIPENWLLKKSSTCGITLGLPPVEEPYVIPRDPNTKPSATDDEGNIWMYEDIEADFFMFDRLVRAIFKDPQDPGSGYVSSAVEFYCSRNTAETDVASLENQLSENLRQNFSVVKIKESIDDVIWNRPAKLIKFSGGSFGEERYILYATQNYSYIIRSFGSTTNKDINDVRDFILNTAQFE